MNAVATVLIALAIHFGGHDIDTGRDVQLQLFQQGAHEGIWTMVEHTAGMYRFGGSSMDLYVQRLPEPDGTYTVTGTDEDGTVLFVSILAVPGQLQSPGTGDGGASPISLASADITVAFARSGPENPPADPSQGEMPIQEVQPVEGREESAVAGLGQFHLVLTKGLITVSDPVDGQVVVVRY